MATYTRRRYRPVVPFNVSMRLLIPTVTMIKGTPKKTFPEISKAPIINCSFRTFGGTESTSNDLYVVLDTATIETWYRPDITSDCRLVVIENGQIYEITGTPEDIEMRHQYLRIRAKRVGGVA